MNQIQDPLAKGLCRPPMFLMAPFDSVVVNIMLSVVVCLLTGKMVLLPVIAVPIHLACMLVCMVEPRAFELVHRYLLALSLGGARRRWRGASLAPARISTDVR